MSQLFTLGGQSIGISASTSESSEHPGLISFRMDWLDLLAVQGTLKSLFQHHILKSFSYSNFELMFNFKNYFTLFAFYDVISYTFIYITLEISPEYSLEGLMLS